MRPHRAPAPSRSPSRLALLAAALGAPLALLAGCEGGGPPPGHAAPKAPPEALALPGDPANFAPLAGMPAMKVPAENPLSAEKVTLGWKLFFDRRLSGDGTLACYSCHVNEKGLTDGRPVAIGAFEKKLTRSSPTLWNIGYHEEWYWDGRAKTLEKQALAAWKLANMGAKDPEKDEVRKDILARLSAEKEYQDRSQAVFGGPLTEERISQALAAYMRTIVSRTTAWDRYQAGDTKAISEAAHRGYEVFTKARCTNCHAGALFTDLRYHNIGIGMKAEKPDVGRFAVTKEPRDTGAFKTPTLRDVARSGPYFHDGSVATLEEAVRLMATGGIDNPHLDRENLKPAGLSEAELADLVEFLKALSETATLDAPRIPGEAH